MHRRAGPAAQQRAGCRDRRPGTRTASRDPLKRAPGRLRPSLSWDPTGTSGVPSPDPAAPREECIEGAAHNAIASFLNDITPLTVVTRVRLDDEDSGQEAVLKTASDGATAQAAHDLELYLQQSPNNASAAYNLAVLKEAMGYFRAALELYDRAIARGGQDYYSRARAGCARRLSAAEALSPEAQR